MLTTSNVSIVHYQELGQINVLWKTFRLSKSLKSEHVLKKRALPLETINLDKTVLHGVRINTQG